jgi:cytochrome c-type biogenesis protein CcmH/NrfG
MIYTQQGSLSDAIRAFSRAHEHSPKDADILYQLAGVQAKTGDLIKARETLEAAHQLAPEQPMILLRLAELQVRMGSNPGDGLIPPELLCL